LVDWRGVERLRVSRLIYALPVRLWVIGGSTCLETSAQSSEVRAELVVAWRVCAELMGVDGKVERRMPVTAIDVGELLTVMI
jgi:hypothetical protein